MKRVLEEDPFNLVIGDIREELEPVSTVKNDVLQDYENFLNEYSTLRCGSVILFGRKELQNFSFLLPICLVSLRNGCVLGK